MTVMFDVPFVMGKGRVRFVKQTGRTYTPDRTAQAMYDIRSAYLAAGGKLAPKDAEVTVHITTVRPLPKSRPKHIESEPDIYRPDVDNIAKLVLDALNGCAWHDDTQVTELVVGKCERVREVTEQTVVWISWEVPNGN